MNAQGKLLVVQVAALGWELVRKYPPSSQELVFRRAATVFPALTCPVQASFRTASSPGAHGMVANGYYSRELRRAMFWEQSAFLVDGPRIWSRFRSGGGGVGMMFWQQSLGEDVDLVLSPAPIHKHEGGMIQSFYSRPPHLYRELARRIGRDFNLMHYWGPLASQRSSAWITEALSTLLLERDMHAPELVLGYIPHLDYDLQRHGTGGRHARRALQKVYRWLEDLARVAREAGYDYLFYGDYAIEETPGGPLYPNRILRAAGFFSARRVGRRTYPDLYGSPAFAMVDHQIAHIYVRDEHRLEMVRELFSDRPEIAAVLGPQEQAQRGIRHPRCGELILVAAKGYWFAYPWWEDAREAPDYAAHVDIHNKPGYDPCELFLGPWMRVGSDPARVRGSHGRDGEGTEVAWTTSLEDVSADSLTALARAVADRLDRGLGK